MLLQTRIHDTDRDKLDTQCKAIFLNEHPECEKMNISRPFLLNKVINFYIENYDVQL